MRPHIICHMLSSIDGKIDAGPLKEVMPAGIYEELAKRFASDAWICGRETMQQHFAEKEPFVSSTNQPAGSQPVFLARRAESYAICVDTLGKLRWTADHIDGDHLICIVSERVTDDYLTMLREKGISYIVSGQSSVNLAEAVELLARQFGIRTLLLEGGGHINGAFLQAGLVDEVSLILVPGIDGRRGIPSVFDGLNSSNERAFRLKLKGSMEQLENDSLYVRYDVLRN